MLPFFIGCTNDDLLVSDDLANELPVEFDLLLPEDLGTRAFDSSSPPKQAFANGDMIHILGMFNTEALQEDGINKTKGKEHRYGALKYNESKKKWEPAPNSNLTWPTIATDGQFKAYYISQSDGVLYGDGSSNSKTYLLSDVTPTTDPLEAISAKGIEYGHAVRLEFKHLCAHLMLEDLEPMVAKKYLFHTDGPLDPETKETLPFNNAYKIYLGKSENEEGGTKELLTLNFEFCQGSDTPYDDIGTYISANVIETKDDDGNGKETVKTKAGYFLEPGYYETFSVHYPAAEKTTYKYLDYDYKKIPEDSEGVGKKNNTPNLEAGKTYTLIITKSPGVEIVNPPSAGGWDETDNYYDVNVEEFLKAVNGKKGYTNDKGEQILEETANGVKLLHNVDFNNCNYNEGFHHKEDQNHDPNQCFYPNILEGVVFDGDYHYIRNLASPLFRYNYGTIQNVGIKNINIEAVSYEDSPQNPNGSILEYPEHEDMSRHGALCMWNRGAATISNVRISDVEMEISVKSFIKVDGNNDDDKDGSETHNIGCVVGSNTGNISEVALAGKFTLYVVGFDEEPFKNNVNASVLIGGIAGQNAATGKIYDVSSYDGTPVFKITNSCKGEIGSYSVGGVVGESSGMIIGVILSNVTIDGTQSESVTSYMGGIVGKAEVSSELDLTAAINSCIVGGSVSAGVTAQYGDIGSVSYIGGMVGADLSVPVVDCRSSVSVHGSAKTNENVIYATGGAFGHIRQSETSTYTFEDLIVYGSALRKPSGDSSTKNYIGNFAGIVPAGQTWDENYANKNITVRKFAGIENIGSNEEIGQ